MDDRLDRARQRGDGPRAPMFVGLFAVTLGLVGAGMGAAAAPWRALAAAGFGLDASASSLLLPSLAPGLVGGALGAVAGVVLGHLLLDRFQPALRWRVRRALERSTGLAILVVVLLAGGATPLLLAAPGGRDPGALLLWAPAVALGLALLFALPVGLINRAWGRSRWKERVAPEPAPRRRPDEAPPEVRGALAAMAKVPPELGDCVVISGDYAAAVALEGAPRLVAHGGAALVAAARDQGLRWLEDAALGAALAALPTGDPLPPRLAARIRAVLR